MSPATYWGYCDASKRAPALKLQDALEHYRNVIGGEPVCVLVNDAIAAEIPAPAVPIEGRSHVSPDTFLLERPGEAAS